MQLLEWIDQETTNRSSFIRETMFMRMMGQMNYSQPKEKSMPVESVFDKDEILNIIQV